jgi:cystathionine gamma-synthase
VQVKAARVGALILLGEAAPCCTPAASGNFPRAAHADPFHVLKMRIETLAVHAGHAVDPATGAVTTPIHLSTTFEREPDGSFRAGHIYTRSSNPNRAAVEQSLASLEGGAAAIAYASGSAATFGIFQALEPGDHVLAPGDAYYGTLRQLRELFEHWGLEHDEVDMTDLPAVERALRPTTKIVWVETPSNPLLRVVNIQRLAELAHTVGARCVVDNTWATPVLQLPLRLGADLVMHSTTKYLGGHSDLLGGAIVARAEDDFVERLRLFQQVGGAVPSPFDCWLLLRGISTLPWRMRAHCDNAGLVAEFLERHPRVEAVHYPGLPSHSGHEIAKIQMNDFGGMVSVQIRGGQEEAMEVTRHLTLFTRATSLGGTESLVEHRASMEGPNTKAPENLLRLSIGLEHPDDLIEDLDRALGAP